MSIQAIIFDYDGVLANSDPFNINGLKYACQEIGLDFSDTIYKQYFTGKTLKDGAEQYLSVKGKPEKVNDFISLKKSYDTHYSDEVIPYADALKFISELGSAYTLVIASGARRSLISIFLKKYQLENTFQFIISAEDYTKGKPDPEVYLLSQSKLAVSKDEVVVIEDSASGVKAAKLAGLKCVGVTHTHNKEDLKECDEIVDSLIEIDLNHIP